MDQPRYSVTELRHMFQQREPAFVEDIVGRLTCDDVFAAAAFQLQDVMKADGSVQLDAPPVRALIGEWIDTAVVETIKLTLQSLDGHCEAPRI